MRSAVVKFYPFIVLMNTYLTIFSREPEMSVALTLTKLFGYFSIYILKVFRQRGFFIYHS